MVSPTARPYLGNSFAPKPVWLKTPNLLLLRKKRSIFSLNFFTKFPRLLDAILHNLHKLNRSMLSLGLIGLFVWRPGLVPLEGLPLNIAQNTLRPLFRMCGATLSCLGKALMLSISQCFSVLKNINQTNWDIFLKKHIIDGGRSHHLQQITAPNLQNPEDSLKMQAGTTSCVFLIRNMGLQETWGESFMASESVS